MTHWQQPIRTASGCKDSYTHPCLVNPDLEPQIRKRALSPTRSTVPLIGSAFEVIRAIPLSWSHINTTRSTFILKTLLCNMAKAKWDVKPYTVSYRWSHRNYGRKQEKRCSTGSQGIFPHFSHTVFNEITYQIISGKDEFKKKSIERIEKLVLQMIKEEIHNENITIMNNVFGEHREFKYVKYFTIYLNKYILLSGRWSRQKCGKKYKYDY